MERSEKIERVISDMVSDLTFYDRKEDIELPVGAIEKAVKSKEVTVEQMVEWFRAYLIESIGLTLL